MVSTRVVGVDEAGFADWPAGQVVDGKGRVGCVGLISRLRRRLFGPTLRWECVDCGTIHRSNPKRCKSCSSTILRQKRND